MRKTKALILIIFFALALAAAFVSCKKKLEPPPEEGFIPTRTVATTKLVSYEGPSIMEPFSDYTVKVEGVDQFVYGTRINRNRIFSFTSPETKAGVVIFDFEGRVKVEVTVNGAETITDVAVRPLAYGITPAVTGNKAEFYLEYPAPYSFEYKKDGQGVASDNALHIFANELETEPVDPSDVPSDTLYIGPGLYEAGAIPVQGYKTIYLAGGSYVYGQIRAEAASGLKIRGRGILSGSIYRRATASEYVLPIEIRNSSGIGIEGITILDPAGWAVTIYKCDGVNITNLKIITARANGDGISVQSSKNVTVTTGFVRSWDDSLVVKNYDRGNTENVLFDGVVIWTDLAQSMETGFETNGERMTGVAFKNVTILHNFHKAAMSIHNSDDADITNVSYVNITLEDGQMLGDNRADGQNDYLIDMTIAYSPDWSKQAAKRGRISNVVFNNIKVLSLADTVKSRMNGDGPATGISGVAINNLEIEGRTVTDTSALGLEKNDFASGITFAGSGTVTGAGKRRAYILALADSNVEKTLRQTKAQEGLEVPQFAISTAAEGYMGEKLDVSDASVTATHGSGDTIAAVYDDGSGIMETEGGELENLLDSDRSSEWIPGPWQGQGNEFFALTFDFGKSTKPGTVRIYLPQNSVLVRAFDVSVFTKLTADAPGFARSMSLKAYKASPASGNYFDIKLPPALECFQLQLRFFRTSGPTAPEPFKIAEIAFYPTSLSTGKPIIASTPYFDVYKPDNLTDGVDSSYWEAVSAEAFAVVDLGAVYRISHINLCLPPLGTWEARTETITVLISEDNLNYSVLFPQADYNFDPRAGNFAGLAFDEIPARYIKLVWSSNTSVGGYGAQLSEIYVYGH
jgi:Endopolygalacturonase